MNLIFLLHVASTLMMTGLVWLIQLVHYPLFSKVGVATYADYQAVHMSSITPLVFPLMTLELVTGIILVAARPASLPLWALVAGLGLIAVIWLATIFLAMPRHNDLSAGFDQTAHQALVQQNWLRTISWSVRAGLVVWMLSRVIDLS